MLLKTVIETREKLAHKISTRIESGERVTHFLYGIAILTEHHWEVTFYSVSALSLGVFALVTVLIGNGEEG